jgi:DNA-binding transcriptional ArsR family regulator
MIPTPVAKTLDRTGLHRSPIWVNISRMDLDDTLVALADGTRRHILQRLAAGDARVTEIAAPFDISLNSVSKHIRILERAGLVRRRIAGRDHFLSLDPAPLDAAAAWMQRERAAWAIRLDKLEAALRAEDAIEAARKSSKKPKPRSKP